MLRYPRLKFKVPLNSDLENDVKYSHKLLYYFVTYKNV